MADPAVKQQVKADAAKKVAEDGTPAGVHHVAITNRGGNYTSPPSIHFAGDPAEGKETAKAIAVIAYGELAYVELIRAGTYTKTPTITFAGGNGEGATAVVVLNRPGDLAAADPQPRPCFAEQNNMVSGKPIAELEGILGKKRHFLKSCTKRELQSALERTLNDGRGSFSHDCLMWATPDELEAEIATRRE